MSDGKRRLVERVPLLEERIVDMVVQRFKGSGFWCEPTKVSAGEVTAAGVAMTSSGGLAGVAGGSIELNNWKSFIVRSDIMQRWEALVTVHETTRSSVQHDGRMVQCSDISLDSKVQVSDSFSGTAGIVAAVVSFLTLPLCGPGVIVSLLGTYYIVKAMVKSKTKKNHKKGEELGDRVEGILGNLEGELRALALPKAVG